MASDLDAQPVAARGLSFGQKFSDQLTARKSTRSFLTWPAKKQGLAGNSSVPWYLKSASILSITPEFKAFYNF
jgi:hypothetical protein